MVLSSIAYGQTIEEPFSKKKMKKDFEVFKEIRLKANSGLQLTILEDGWKFGYFNVTKHSADGNSNVQPRRSLNNLKIRA